jgi:hypothetical protein
VSKKKTDRGSSTSPDRDSLRRVATQIPGVYWQRSGPIVQHPGSFGCRFFLVKENSDEENRPASQGQNTP